MIECSESIPEAPAGSDTASGYGGELGTRIGPLTLRRAGTSSAVQYTCKYDLDFYI